MVLNLLQIIVFFLHFHTNIVVPFHIILVRKPHGFWRILIPISNKQKKQELVEADLSVCENSANCAPFIS